jgi:hypothetical protein
MISARVKQDSIIPNSFKYATILKKMNDWDVTAGTIIIWTRTMTPNDRKSKITGLLDITWSAFFTF